MDQLGGVDFTKGCYVGQEVVSRMEHRGIARTRTVPVPTTARRPRARRACDGRRPPGGQHGFARSGGRGLALLRLDRVADALSRRRPSPCRRCHDRTDQIAGWISVLPSRTKVRSRRRRPPVRAPPDDRLLRCPWPRTIRCTLPITTTNGACPSTTTARCGKSWCSTASRPACRGSPSCASARPSARAFAGFDPEIDRALRRGEDRARLMADAGIVRYRAKIDAADRAARASIWTCARRARTSRSSSGVSPAAGRSDEPCAAMSAGAGPDAGPRAMAKALKARGFKFCGPVIVYAFMQAVGMVNDHLVTCFRHARCRSFKAVRASRGRRPPSGKAEEDRRHQGQRSDHYVVHRRIGVDERRRARRRLHQRGAEQRADERAAAA